MARCMRLDDQDKRALRALDDDFTISADGETATVAECGYGALSCWSSSTSKRTSPEWQFE